MKYYLAARYSRRLELCGYRADLAGLGIEVTSRWLNGSHQLDDKAVPITDEGDRRFEAGDPAVDHLRAHFATEDMADVMAAETLVVFTEQPRVAASRGGRHVELGLARGAGKRSSSWGRGRTCSAGCRRLSTTTAGSASWPRSRACGSAPPEARQMTRPRLLDLFSGAGGAAAGAGRSSASACTRTSADDGHTMRRNWCLTWGNGAKA